MRWAEDAGVLFRSKLEGSFDEEGGENIAEAACEALWPVVPAKSHTVAKKEPDGGSMQQRQEVHQDTRGFLRWRRRCLL